MNREIKFKGKSLKTGEWLYGDLIQDIPNKRCAIVPQKRVWQVVKYEVIPESVGEYIGLKDKNGKEIYEGDICIFDILNTLNRHPDINPYKKYLHVIEWKSSIWGFTPLYPELQHEDDREWKSFCGDNGNDNWDVNYFEVIGNIYENPELIIRRTINQNKESE